MSKNHKLKDVLSNKLGFHSRRKQKAFESKLQSSNCGVKQDGLVRDILDNNGVGLLNPNTIPMVASFDFVPNDGTELAFKRSDILSVDVNPSVRWWKATNWRTGETGKVPDSYLTDQPVEKNLAFEAWQEITREEAQRQLLMHGLPEGTYILRPSSEPCSYGLSVLYKQYGDFDVIHYKISQSPQDESVYISSEHTFPSLNDLISHYKDPNNRDLVCTLQNPRPKNFRSTNKFNDCRVSRESVKLIECLGRGNFGEVHLAKYRSVLVAVKMGLCSTTNKDIVDEASTMNQLFHPRLVRLLGVCCEPASEPIYIITEYMPKGSLHAFLQTKEGHELQLEKLTTILEEVLQGMVYLESRGAVHNDLRAANVLVDKDNSVKVADFGLAKILGRNGNDMRNGTFPLRWTAPEATKEFYMFNIKADVWSFGVLMFEVLTYASLPYEELSDDEVLDAIENGYRLQNPKMLDFVCDDTLYEIMLTCWAEDPENRPSFFQLEGDFKGNLSTG